MKRVIGIVAFAMMLALPMGVKADLAFQESSKGSKDGFYCDVTKQDANGNAVEERCYVVGRATGGSSISRFTAVLTLQNMSVVAINANTGAGWTDATQSWSASSTTINLAFNNANAVSASPFTIATIDVKVNTVGEKCAIQLTPCYDENGNYTCGNTVVVTETYVCKIVNGKYYGKNGTEVTAAVYEAECVNNPQTGNFVPYVVIIAGIALAVGVFTISRKNTKLYKI